MNNSFDTAELSWVRLSFVDVFGSLHSKQIPAGRFQAAMQEGEPFDGSVLEGRGRLLEVDMLLRPDQSTVIKLGSLLGGAICTILTSDGSPWAGDPRTALQATIERLGAAAGGYTAGAELEFYLLDADRRPMDRGGYFSRIEGEGDWIARAAADRIAEWGFRVDGTHHEAGPGQYELDLAPLDPLGLADGLVITKQAIRDVAAKAGLFATFMPRPFTGQPGSGLHIHQRIEDAFDDDGALLPGGASFVAGQLAHAEALSALANPNVNSYKRLHSGPEAPGAAVWAHLNRGALIRISQLGSGPTVEFRGADPAANPYLLIAGLMVAGVDGIETGAELPPPFDEDAGGFDPVAGDSVLVRPLPRDLDGALSALMADDVLVDAFDGQLLSRLVDGRRTEANEYRSQVTQWELERYLDEGL